MARKGQATIQDSINTNEEFEAYLGAHAHQLICMEVYSDFCGFCLATAFAIRKGKMEIGQERIAMARAISDIDALSRFKDKSEPVFLFIMKGKLTRAMFGSNGTELCSIIEEELGLMQREVDTGIERPKLQIDEMLPEESAKIEAELKLEEEYREAASRLKVLTLAARKRRIANRLAQSTTKLNFILFWPHCHQAHFDLYEKWDMINIQVGAKDTVVLDEFGIKEALYMSDVDPNEACLHALMNGECLIVLFKISESDTRDFVKLLRYALYEEIPVPKDDVPPEKQVPPIPAYERYATISKTAREIRRDRYEAKMQKIRDEIADKDRLEAEQARLAREAQEEEERLAKQRQEEERIYRLQQGLPALPEPDVVEENVEGEEAEEAEEKAETDATVEAPAEDEDVKVEAEEEFHSDVSIEGEEYIPPGGLFVPGLYAPPNELAKATGLAYFYPKIVSQLAKMETEYLPPHVLVMFSVDKRAEVQEIIKTYSNEILAVGVFVGEDLSTAEHVAFSIKHYDKMERLMKHKDRLAVMVSRKRSLPLLQLAGLNPCYISADVVSGERDCLQLFPVGYGDEYEEEETLVEEEIMEVEPVPEPEQQSVVEAEPKENEDEDEGED